MKALVESKLFGDGLLPVDVGAARIDWSVIAAKSSRARKFEKE